MRLRFILGLNWKSKLSRRLSGSRKRACFWRRSSSRLLRQVISSETSMERMSMGAMFSVCAWSRRVSSTATMPPRRSWCRARLSSIRFMIGFLEVDALLNQVAILGQLADERIDLAQSQWRLRAAFEIPANETVLGHSQFQGRGTGFLRGGTAILLGQREQAHYAAQSGFALALMDHVADSADVLSCLVGSLQQAQRMRRRAPGAIFVADTMRAALLLDVFAQQLAGARIEQAHIHRIPLHIDQPTDPARRRAIVGRVDFNTAIDMDRSLSVLVIAERLQRQRLQQGLLFGEHRRHLPLGAAVDARVCPVLFPAIEICLGLFQALEALALQWCLLCMSNA